MVLKLDSQDKLDFTVANWFQDSYRWLCTRSVKSKNLMVKTEFNKNCRATQQKGRGVPTHLQEQVEEEINKLLDQDHV